MSAKSLGVPDMRSSMYCSLPRCFLPLPLCKYTYGYMPRHTYMCVCESASHVFARLTCIIGINGGGRGQINTQKQHVCMSGFASTCFYPNVIASAGICRSVCVFPCVSACAYFCLRVCVYLCLYISLCVYLCLYVSIFTCLFAFSLHLWFVSSVSYLLSLVSCLL